MTDAFCCNKTDFCNSETIAIKRFNDEIATTTKEPDDAIAIENPQIKFQKLQLSPDDGDKENVETKKLNNEDEEAQEVKQDLNAELWRNGVNRPREMKVFVLVVSICIFFAQ